MSIDYLIVGQGLAGTILGFRLIQAGKSIKIIDPDNYSTSSKVAAGIYNPITGKRMVKSWKVDTLYPEITKFYTEIERLLGGHYDRKMTIHKIFNSQEQETDFIVKTGEEQYQNYVGDFGVEVSPNFKKPYGSAFIINGGVLDTKAFVKDSRSYFESQNILLDEKLSYDKLHEYDARNVVFCEGFEVMNNPWFCWLPMASTRGEMLVIDAPELPREHIINKGVFMVPRNETEFLVGATFALTTNPVFTEKGLGKLIDKLEDTIKTSYKIVDKVVGIRPTVKDRRPLIGRHPKENNFFVFNGFGTKGVSLIPYWSKVMVDFLENGKELDSEVNIDRYSSLYKNSIIN